MAKAQKSGIIVQKADVALILAMVKRGDRRHDIAAWFGLNQGRIKEVEDGRYGTPPLAPTNQLPPSGSPGVKARRFRDSIEKIHQLLKKQDAQSTKEALQRLEQAIEQFDKNE